MSPTTDPAGERPLRVLALTGGHRVDMDAFLGAVSGICADRGWLWAHATQPSAQAWLRPENAGTWDAILCHDIPGIAMKRGTETRAVGPDHDTAQALVDLLGMGQGIVVLHHAISAWPGWEGWAEAIGGRFLYFPSRLRGEDLPSSGYRMDHYGVRVLDPDHPITRGVPDFEVDDELYYAPVFTDRIHPLLRADADFDGKLFDDTWDTVTNGASTGVTCEGRPPTSDLIGWTTSAGASPIAYIGPGDGGPTFGLPAYRQLLGNALAWVASPQAHEQARATNFEVALP